MNAKDYAILFGILGFIAFLIGLAITHHEDEAKKEKTIEVTVVGNPTNSPNSRYSYTECTFNYGGKRYMTDMQPCVAVPGEHLLINIDEHGSVIISTAKYP